MTLYLFVPCCTPYTNCCSDFSPPGRLCTCKTQQQGKEISSFLLQRPPHTCLVHSDSRLAPHYRVTRYMYIHSFTNAAFLGPVRITGTLSGAPRSADIGTYIPTYSVHIVFFFFFSFFLYWSLGMYSVHLLFRFFRIVRMISR